MKAVFFTLMASSWISFLFGCGSAMSSKAQLNSSAQSESPLDDFKSIQSQYFPKLDLRAPAEQIATMPQFAAHLSKIADQTRLKLADGTISSPEQCAEAGLIFIYDALMTHNNTHATTEGLLSLESLKMARRFSGPNSSDHDELKARAQYAKSELMTAAELRRDDRRIDSWLASVKTVLERIQTGQISDNSLSAVLDTIDVRPTFNLWTAILVFRGHDALSDLFARLVSASKNFVDSSGSGNDPCTIRPQDCGNGRRAPYNFQASVTVLGDVFLRKASQLIKAGDIASGMPLAHYAKGTYDMLTKPAHLPDTQNWPDREGIALRQEAVVKLLSAQPIDDAAFVASDAFRRTYECSSCHGRAAK